MDRGLRNIGTENSAKPSSFLVAVRCGAGFGGFLVDRVLRECPRYELALTLVIRRQRAGMSMASASTVSV